MDYTAVFDIGKTNKKCFVFDEDYREVFHISTQFEEIPDEDGFPSDNLQAIRTWILDIFQQALDKGELDVKALNFSTYGASFVHVDEKGNVLTPLYNYTKPYPAGILRSFYEKYGDPMVFSRQTASPPLGMLNSGLQLYWLKHARPELFGKIRWSLHFPQYLSFLFTGVPVSDYTGIGCHTGLWDFENGDYHQWVYAEEIDRILPPIVPACAGVERNFNGKQIKIGAGIHDSSAALLPYLRAEDQPFLLISTGTWSIALNPFNEEGLRDEDLQNDCLNYLQTNGRPVRAARLFLGNEYALQLRRLNQYFGKTPGHHQQIRFDPAIYTQLLEHPGRYFRFESLPRSGARPSETRLESFPDFETALHQLMLELTELQVESARRAIGRTAIRKIYIDGGFADNDIYVKLLLHHFPGFEICTTQTPLGSALGAALVISEKKTGRDFLEKHYVMKKHTL